MEKNTQYSLWYVTFALFGIILLQNLWQGVRTTAPIPYSEFQSLLHEGKVAEISVTDNQIIGTYKEAIGNKTRFATTRVDPALAKDFAQYDVKVTGMVENTFLSDQLGWVLPAVIFVAIWIFAMRRFAGKMGGGGFMNIGKSVGASGMAVAGAAIGTVPGLAAGLVGALIGPVLGAIAGEWLARRNGGQASRAGLAAGIGFLLGIVAKIGIAFMMVGIFAVAWLF